MKNTLLLALNLVFILFLSCDQKERVINPIDFDETFLWSEYKLAKSNESPLRHKKGRIFRLILENSFGGNDYILGISDLGDQYLVYQKEINKLSSNYSSRGLLLESDDFDSIWNNIKLVSDSLKHYELKDNPDGSKQVIDASIWTLELNMQRGEYLFQRGVVDEELVLLKKLYSYTPFIWPMKSD